MPLNKKGEEIKEAMEKEYGEKKGKEVFYASENKGTISGVTKHEHAGKVMERHKEYESHEHREEHRAKEHESHMKEMAKEHEKTMNHDHESLKP